MNAIEAWLATDEGFRWSRESHRASYHPGIYTIEEDPCDGRLSAGAAYHHDPRAARAGLPYGYGPAVVIEDGYAGLPSPA